MSCSSGSFPVLKVRDTFPCFAEPKSFVLFVLLEHLPPRGCLFWKEAVSPKTPKEITPWVEWKHGLPNPVWCHVHHPLDQIDLLRFGSVPSLSSASTCLLLAFMPSFWSGKGRFWTAQLLCVLLKGQSCSAIPDQP